MENKKIKGANNMEMKMKMEIIDIKVYDKATGELVPAEVYDNQDNSCKQSEEIR